MNRSAPALLLLLGSLVACTDSPTDPSLGPSGTSSVRGGVPSGFTVSSEMELREALAADLPQNAVRAIRLLADIELSATAQYGGPQPLRIAGDGTTITGPETGDALAIISAADLTLEEVTIAGAGGHGVHVVVPADAEGTVRVELESSALHSNGLSGLWIDDQVHGSAAGIRLVVRGSRIEGNGYRDGAEFADHDGIRVNEGGAGDLHLEVDDSHFTGNAADGIELDETGAGDVISIVRHSTFSGNGDQPQNPDDLEDGFDIDEADEGGIRAEFLHVVASENEDEGIDLDEEGAGGISVRMNQVRAAANQDANIAFTEDEAGEVGGDVEFHFSNVIAVDSRDDDGVKIEEFGPGDLRGTLVHSRVTGNADDGIQAEQSHSGEGALRLQQVEVSPNGDDPVNTDGVLLVVVGASS